MRRHERSQIPNVPWVSHSNLHKSENFFTKPVSPLDPLTSDLQDPKISGPDDKPCTSSRLRRHQRQFHAPPHPATRLHVPHVPSSAMTSWMTSLWRHSPLRSDPFVQADPIWPIYPDPVRTACQKKKKRKRKRKSFDQVELWLWPKSQNFQKRLVPLSFSSTFWFWDPFLHLKLGNCANCPIPKKLTFGQILTKKSKFSRSTYLAQFFA